MRLVARRLRLGDALTASATVTGQAPNGSGGSLDPVGAATFSYCYSADGVTVAHWFTHCHNIRMDCMPLKSPEMST